MGPLVLLRALVRVSLASALVVMSVASSWVVLMGCPYCLCLSVLGYSGWYG